MSDSTKQEATPVILTGYSSGTLAHDMAEALGWDIIDLESRLHNNKEIEITLGKGPEGNVRGREVVVVASASGDPNRLEKETRLMMRAAKDNDASTVTLVLPYMYYGRSDDEFGQRGTAALADTIETFKPHCDRVIVADPHNPSVTKRLFLAEPRTPCNIANFAYPFATQLNDLFRQNVISKENLMLLYPDAGASKRISEDFRIALYGTAQIDLDPARKDEWAQAMASRDRTTGKKDITVTDDVTGKDIVIFEDLVDTAGTACQIARQLKEKGARSVIMFASTGMFTSSQKQKRSATIGKINDSALDAVFITDTFFHHRTHPSIHKAIEQSPIIHVIKTGPMLAAMVEALHLKVTPNMPGNLNSVSDIMKGIHPKQQNGHTLAEATPLHPQSPLLKLTA